MRSIIPESPCGRTFPDSAARVQHEAGCLKCAEEDVERARQRLQEARGLVRSAEDAYAAAIDALLALRHKVAEKEGKGE